MASQTSQQSPLFEGQGAALVDAHKKTKDTEPITMNADLPGGLTNAIAQLVLCKFDKYKEGKYKDKPYFMGAGVVKVPQEVSYRGHVVRVAGRRTQIGPIPLCDTLPEGDTPASTFLQQYDKMLTHLKLLAGKKAVASIEAEKPGETLSQKQTRIEKGLIDLAAALVKVKPHFIFGTRSGTAHELENTNGKWFVNKISSNDKRTRVGGPFNTEEEAKKKFPYAGQPPTVFHDWLGFCNPPTTVPSVNGQPGAAPQAAGVSDDQSEEAPPQEQSGDGQQDVLPFNETDNPQLQQPSEEPAAALHSTDGLPDDLTALVNQADDPDGDYQAARTQLETEAKEKGIDPDAIDTWLELAGEIAQARAGDQSEEEEAPDQYKEQPPAVEQGQEVLMNQLDKNGNQKVNPVNKKPLKPVKCKVTSVDYEKKTANLKNMVDGKTLYKNVKWATFGMEG
jgi:hypothetical protein